MRKLALTVLLAAMGIACESETPLGPGTVKVTQSTSTTTSTTTSTIPPSTTADFIFSPLTPAALEVVSFNAFGSIAAPGRTIVAYHWDFGDGQSKVGVAVTHDFFPQGLYIVTLTVTDSAGEQAKVSKPIGAGVPLPSTTTTSISTNTAVRYVSPSTAPDIPADLSLFFQLLAGQSVLPPVGASVPGLRGLGDFRFVPLADSKYSVQGFYSQRNGVTGTISGELVGTLTPAPSGTFTGTLTSTLNGCTATRPFSGPLSSGSLQWKAMAPATGGCQPNPLAFSSMDLQKSDAPPPVPPTTTTTTPTTTSVLCNYSLNPVSATFEAQGPAGSTFQTGTIGLTATSGCSWSMQTSTPWITLVAPVSGNGSATLSFQVANYSPSDGQRRVGSIVIAGITFLVTQNPPSDLATFIPPPDTDYCRIREGNVGNVLMVGVRNPSRVAAPAFATAVIFTTSSDRAPRNVTTSGLAAGGSTDLTFQVPGDCFSPTTGLCSFDIAVDPSGAVAEADEGNNRVTGTCGGDGELRLRSYR